MPKAAIKRNLFGDQNEDETSAILAKQLTDSPQNQQSYSFLMDPAIQSVKCNEFSYKAQAKVLTMESKGLVLNTVISASCKLKRLCNIMKNFIDLQIKYPENFGMQNIPMEI